MMGAIALVGALALLLGAWLAARSGWARGGTATFGLAAFSAGPAIVAAFAAALLARAVIYLAGISGPMGVVGVTAGNPTDPKPLLDAFFRLSAGFAAIAAIAFVIHAFAKGTGARPQGPRVGGAMPLGSACGIAAIVCGLISGASFVSAPLAWSAVGLPLDLAALAPVVAFALGIRLVARPAPESNAAEKRVAPGEPKLTTKVVDPEPLLRKAGVLGEKPFFDVPGKAAAPSSREPDAIDRAWNAAGGTGSAPTSLRLVVDSIGPSGGAHLVGDVPVPTEDALLQAALLHLLTSLGERAIVVGDQPQARREALRRILESSGSWPSGPLVAGGGELERALSEGLLPSIAFLDLDALSRHGRLLATGHGRVFADGVSLLVLPNADGHGPIEATHLQFSMRRLGLLWSGRAMPAVVATGGSTPQSRRYVEDLVGRPVRLIPVGLETTAAVRVHRSAQPANNRSAERDAIRKALGAFANQPVEIVVEDANGHLSAPDVDLPHVKARLARTPSVQGDVSLSLVDDGSLAQLYRQSRNRIVGAQKHHAVWWVPVTPLSRFLLQPNVMASLEQTGELPTPRPVSGRRNRWLAAAHLEAALSEGAHDETALRAAFGDEAVSERLGLEPKLQIAGHRARLDGKTEGVQRATVWQPPPGQRWTDPTRSTVTRDVLEIVDERSGNVLATVDRRLAPTRFHPLRVFGHGSGRYQVPADAWSGSPPRGKLPVRPADERAGWTVPNLEIALKADVLEAEPVVLAKHDVSIAVASLPVEVHESVRGARTLDASASDLSFAPVSTNYPSRAAVAFLAWSPSNRALFHLARTIDAILPAHVRAAPEDVEVLALPDGLAGLARPALVFVDRHLGGMGIAEVLDADAIHDLLRWARGILFHCPCMDGCQSCTPAEVLAAGADKQGVLGMLAASGGVKRSA